MAQLVEHHLAKVRVAGSNPVVRSNASNEPVYELFLTKPAFIDKSSLGLGDVAKW